MDEDQERPIYEAPIEPLCEDGEPELKPIKELKLNDLFKLGMYTIWIMVAMKFVGLNMLGNAFYMIFASAAPKVISCGAHDLSHAADIMDSCRLLKEIQKTENCTPEFDYQFKSINVEWGYYCEGTKIVKNSITYQMIGLLIGAILFGQISDLYGRKKAILIALTCNNLFIFISSYATDLVWFTFWRFMVNIFNAGCITVLPIFALEILPPKHRYWINNIVGGSLLVMIAAPMAYYSADWRTYSRAIAAVGIPAVLSCCESPRFLIQKGRIQEAKNVLRRIYRIDRRDFNEPIIDEVLAKENKIFLEKQSKNQKYTLVHLFYTPNLTRYALAIALTFFTTSMLTYALMFNLENIAGSIYWNLVLTGIVRYIAGGIMSGLEIKCPKMGRKTIHLCLLLIASTSLLSIFVINILGEFTMVVRAMALIVLGFIAQIFLVASICATELFPTGIRNLSYSFGQFFNRVGVVLSPQVFFLAYHWKPLPYLAMFLLVFINMVFFQFNVTETKNNPLSDHMPGPEESWCGRRKAKKNRPSLANPLDEKNQKLIHEEKEEVRAYP